MTDEKSPRGSAELSTLLRKELLRSSRFLLLPALWIALAVTLKGAGPGRPEPLLEGLPLLALVFYGGLAIFLARDAALPPPGEASPAPPIDRKIAVRAKGLAFLSTALAGTLIVLVALLVVRRDGRASPDTAPRISPASGPGAILLPTNRGRESEERS